MLILPIYVSPRSISIIASALSGALPAVAPTQRWEALARGLGLPDGDALQAALLGRPAGPVNLDSQSFVAHVARWDHQVSVATLFGAAALSALDMVARYLPLLGRSGYGAFLAPADREEFGGESGSDRMALTDPVAVPGFLQAVRFLQDAPRALGTDPGASSYALKHLAERQRYTWSDGSRMGTGYVSNGEMIAAGVYSGLDWALDEAAGSRNMLLNVDARRVARLERRALRHLNN